jgi:UDP-glucuronate decarboxylase
MSTKRILVTGGAGFIGSHLCKTLLNQGHEVICLDNYLTGEVGNVTKLLGNPRFRLVEHDIIEPLHLEVEEIYNLACPASPPHYQDNPIKTVKTNILGVLNMLDMASTLGAKVLHASTSEVYGDPLVHPQREDYWGNVNPIGKRSCYDEGKRCAETLCFDYYRQYGTNIKVVRIFNTYGPNMHPKDGRVISNFVLQALQNQDITVYGDGSQTRSFCYIDDLIQGLTRMMETMPGCTGPINLGNPSEFSIIELVEKILLLTNSKSRVVFNPLPPDDPQRRRPDIKLAQSTLDWRPSVSLDEGLDATIAYFRQKLGCN